jgi:hypothetical protein
MQIKAFKAKLVRPPLPHAGLSPEGRLERRQVHFHSHLLSFFTNLLGNHNRADTMMATMQNEGHLDGL